MSNNERIVAIEEHFISPTMANEYTLLSLRSALHVGHEGLEVVAELLQLTSLKGGGGNADSGKRDELGQLLCISRELI